MYSHVRLEVEIEGESFAAQVAFVWLLARVHEHVPFKFGVVKEALATAIMRTLEQFIPMHSVMFLK